MKVEPLGCKHESADNKRLVGLLSTHIPPEIPHTALYTGVGVSAWEGGSVRKCTRKGVSGLGRQLRASGKVSGLFIYDWRDLLRSRRAYVLETFLQGTIFPSRSCVETEELLLRVVTEAIRAVTPPQ